MRPSDRIARKSANEFAMKIHRPEDLTLVQTRSRGHRLRRPRRRRLATPRRSFAFHFTKAQNNASNSCLKLKGKVAAFTSAYAMPPVSTRRWTHVCIRTHMRKRACVRACADSLLCVSARICARSRANTRVRDTPTSAVHSMTVCGIAVDTYTFLVLCANSRWK